jgi:hypothetical protein
MQTTSRKDGFLKVRKNKTQIRKKIKMTSCNDILEEKEITEIKELKTIDKKIIKKKSKKRKTKKEKKPKKELKPLPEIIVYSKNVLLFGMIILLNQQTEFSWALAIYLQLVFSLVCLVLFGLSRKETQSAVVYEVFFSLYLMCYVLYHGLIEEFPLIEPFMLVLYIFGLSVSIICFFKDIFWIQEQTMKKEEDKKKKENKNKEE